MCLNSKKFWRKLSDSGGWGKINSKGERLRVQGKIKQFV